MSRQDQDDYFKTGPGAWLTNLALRAVLSLPAILPYRWRVPAVGWLTAYAVAPLAGYLKRNRDHLRLIYPDMPEDDLNKLARAAADCAGRTLAEGYSGKAFIRHVQGSNVSGAGVEAVDAAHAAKRPVIAITGHFGNYDAARAVAVARGFKVGVLYRPFTNYYFDRHYRRMLEQTSKPIFPVGRRGLAGMLKHLRAGNMVAILSDQHQRDGAELTFMGRKAYTALSAAEMALKYDALMVPVFAVRQPNGIDFEVIFEEPIPHTTPEQMMQVYNDRLEARVREHPEQWLWTHRRWRKTRNEPEKGPKAEKLS